MFKTKMKIKFLLLLFCIVTVSAINAQNLAVKGFRLLENDLTANTHGTSKTDQNGETAALIKIVTPESGFNFDGGSLGIVESQQKVGEIWVYVPARAQKITISHKQFGVLRDYYYKLAIEAGRTYELLLDLGMGSFSTITSSIPNSAIYVDDDSCGVSPVYNRYLIYGKHIIRAVNEKFEGEEAITIVKDSIKDNTLLYNIEMKDMSHLYGKVNVSVNGNADIYFNGKKRASGRWNTELREGNYVLETRKVDCESVKTPFNVNAGTVNNIEANMPIPHTGYLRLYTRPRLVSVYNGNELLNVKDQISLPVGSYQLSFKKSGYTTKDKEYKINYNGLTADTVTLERISYLKKFAFYFGGGYTLSNLSGASGILGCVLYNVDLQLSYTFGMNKSKNVNWYNETDNSFYSRTQYSLNALSLKFGYQINASSHFALTPQVGYSSQSLACSTTLGNGKLGDGASCGCVTAGLKLLLVPFQHLYIFAAPEFDVAMSQDENFKSISSSSGFTAGGFVCNAGILINF